MQTPRGLREAGSKTRKQSRYRIEGFGACRSDFSVGCGEAVARLLLRYAQITYRIFMFPRPNETTAKPTIAR